MPLPSRIYFFITMVFVIVAQILWEQSSGPPFHTLKDRSAHAKPVVFPSNSATSRSKTVLLPLFPLANTRCSLRSHTELRSDAGGCSWLEKQIPRPRLCAGNAVPAAPRVRARRRTRGKGCSCPAAGPPARPRALPTCSGPQFAVCKMGRVAAPTSMGGEN